MSSDFDPSPRSSKRRKTTRYGAQRTILSDDTPEEIESIDQAVLEGLPQIVKSAGSAISSARKASSKRKTKEVLTEKGNNYLSNGVPNDDEHEKIATPSRGSKQSVAHKRDRQVPLTNVDAIRSGQTENGRLSSAEEGEVQGIAEESANNPAGEETPKTRSSGRQRKKPNRFAVTLDDVPAVKPTTVSDVNPESPRKTGGSPVVKGILTPSRKRKTPRPRKSVMFDQDEAAIGEQLGFKDIGTPGNQHMKTVVGERIPRQAAVSAKELFLNNRGKELAWQNEENDLDVVVVDDFSEHLAIPDTAAEDPTFTSLDEDGPQIQEIKSEVMSRLTSNSLPSKAPIHLDSQYTQLHSLLHSTIVSSESNSLLLLGPRGVGKSMLLSLALQNLASEYSSNFHTVRLNGFLQTDDRLALREIWRQLGREMQVDEMETEDVAGSYADTMASLLSLLSHPDELGTNGEVEGDDVEALASNALQMASGGQRTSKSIVFILDEFDLFTTHPRQTLLYNLFDIAQSRKAPIAVIGCSTRMDVIECLEKRVKSRFSHRWLLIPSCRNFVEWETCVKENLLAQSPDKLLSKNSEDAIWKAKWNKHIETTFLPSKEIQNLLKHHFYTTKALPDLFISLYPMIATLTLTDPTNNHPIPKQPSPLSDPNPNILTLLPHLPTLHTSLLISHSRLETIHHLASANFNLIYTHYTELIAQSRLRQTAHGSISVSGTLRCWSRETCRAAWEDLGRWGLVVPVSGAREDGAGVDGEAEETRMWKCEVTLEDLVWGVGISGTGSSGGGKSVLERWCREV